MKSSNDTSADASYLFAGPGEVRAVARELDWSTSPLGPTTGWSPALRTMARSIFESPFPICLWSGPQFALVYNDPYRRILGAKHPASLGQPGAIVWAEIWDELRPQFEGVRAGGDAIHFEDAPFVMARLEGGGTETAWFNYALSALRDEDGSVAAVLNITPETSSQVLLKRRLEEEQTALAMSEERFRALANASSDMIYRMSPDWKEMRHLDGRSILADTDSPSIAWMDEYLLPEDLAEIQGSIDRAIEGKVPFELEHRVRQADGSIGWTFSRAIPMTNEHGTIVEWFGAATDTTRLVSARKFRDALIHMTSRFDGLSDPYDIGYAAVEVIGRTLDASRVGYGTIDPVAETLHVERDWTALGVDTLAGVTPLRDYGSFIDSLKRGEFISITDVDKDERTASAADALKGRSSFSFMNVPVMEDGVLVAVLFVNNGAVRDWTDDERAFVQEAGARTRSAVERSRTDAALRELNVTLQERIDRALADQAAVEEALRQAQKMEAVGQLTGGLAHDFNNLLAGMMGNLELLQLRLAKGRFDDLDRFITAAQGAGRRAASLTQRLLAFSRRQTLDPRPTDVNRLISGLQEMLQRTVGASADIEIVGAAGLWTTNIDAGQLENAILNLCINGRDAMPDGGKLTIETANKWIDDRTGRDRQMSPGQYVSVCVTDTGTGMDEATIARAFEPFYTTKPIGQGTGLGLSMIYGFAQQSGGQVCIYSELGQGTTVCVYLPRHYGEAVDVTEADTAILTSSAKAQTVLLVDDEATIRHVIDEALDDLGYKVIGAADGAGGIKVLQSGAKIDLLITDVGLPNGMNGRQVADAARVIRPGLKVLFITGFAENAAVGNGHLEPGMELLTKPFTLEALSVKVADMLRRTTM